MALGTQLFQQWYDKLLYVMFGAVGLAVLIGLWTLINSRRIPKWLMVLPIIGVFIFIGMFERVREFIRKPYVIGDYMYANAIRVDDYPLLQRDGILPHSTFVSVQEVTEENKLEAGENVFLIACTRCHTTSGINSVVNRFERMYGKDNPLNVEAMKTYMRNMHNARYYMPPFPGNEKELDALAQYIQSLQIYPRPIEGAQLNGTPAIEYDIQKIKEKIIN
ncbi:MAG: cytochrome c [Bacteroidota bacterium]|nr:cytochrome c [Bacteroidota bacterium]